MSTLSTTNLRVISRNPAVNHHVPARTAAKATSDERSRESRNSLLRMGVAAALAPALWLVHALAQRIQHGF